MEEKKIRNYITLTNFINSATKKEYFFAREDQLFVISVEGKLKLLNLPRQLGGRRGGLSLTEAQLIVEFIEKSSTVRDSNSPDGDYDGDYDEDEDATFYLE